MDKNSPERTAQLAECERTQAALQRQLATEEAQERARNEARARLPNPRIGMTRKQVIEASNWGEPEAINETTSAAGVREQWVYGSGHFLYFINGRLATIQRSR
jgi:hypothetical protein